MTTNAQGGSSQAEATGLFAGPWPQLIVGIICMACVANLQYGWTLFVNPIDAKFHWGRPDIQVAFTIFVLIETWLIPVEGYLVDRFGPRWVVIGGGLLVAAAWALNSVADSLMLLYVGAALGGIGTGCVYGTCVGNALKWFPGRRGLAAGFTAAGFGAGAAITVVPIANMIAASGYQQTFPVLRAPARRDRGGDGAGHGQGACQSEAQGGCGGAPRQPARGLHAGAGAAHAPVLGDVRDVRADRGRRADDGRLAGADREGFQDRQGAGAVFRRGRCRR